MSSNTTKTLKALAHEYRLEIIHYIEQEGKGCVCDIKSAVEKKFSTSQSNISQHLKVLKEADVLGSEKIGGYVYYSIKNERVLALIDGLARVNDSSYINKSLEL